MAMRDVVKLIESLVRAGTTITPDIARSLQAMLGSTGRGKARSSEVMTSVGPDNARAYSAILSGKESMDVRNAATAKGIATLLPSTPTAPSVSRPVIPLDGPDASRPVIPLDDAKEQSKLRTAVKRLSTPGPSRPVIPIREDEPIDLPGPSVAADVKGLTWAERHQRLKEAGRLLSSADVAARTLKRKPSQRDIVTESERQEQRLRDQEAKEFARSKPVLPLTPEAPPVIQRAQQQEQKVEQNKLLEAIKRLTETVKEANRPRRTVAQDVAGLSWGERWSRLQASSNLLSEDVVKAATLKERVSKRDIILESERREQQKRDRENATPQPGGRLGSILNLGQALLRGGAGGGGGGAGAAAGAAGAGGGGMGGVVARLAGIGSNPYVLLAGAAVAAGVALLKLPGATERLAASLMESRRHLRLYDGALAATFARLDVQQRLLDIRTAQSTSGSTSMLGSSLENLRNETQWARESKDTVMNLGTTVVVQLGRLVNVAVKNAPAVQQTVWLLKGIEKLLSWWEPSKGSETLNEHLRAISSGEWAKPKNRKPATRRSDAKKEKDD